MSKKVRTKSLWIYFQKYIFRADNYMLHACLDHLNSFVELASNLPMI